MYAMNKLYLLPLLRFTGKLSLFLYITTTLQTSVILGKGHPVLFSSHVSYACKLVGTIFLF